MDILLSVVVVLVCGVLWWWRQRGARFRKMMEVWPGPPTLPLLGNAHQLGTTTVDFQNRVEHYCKEYNWSPFRMWVGVSQVFLIISHFKDIEIILGSNKILDKKVIYEYLKPWLGTGLLTSSGSKWRRHRKILTPTFHFKILEEFIDVFNTNGAIMTEKLKKEVSGPGFDIYKYVTLCALDIICETAMGVKINAQSNSESEYVKAVRDLSDVIMKRATKPWLGPDYLFQLSSMKTVHDKALKILHDTTNSVIKARKAEITKEKASRDPTKGEDDVRQSDGAKKRLAFLDMLIESTFNGSELTDLDIREEVDTFMFEGHDTTSSGISFTLWLLSWHQDIQDKVFQELDKVFPDPGEPLTFRGLQELKYLERVIKESLRLYPSVPAYARQLNEDVVLSDGRVAPTGLTIFIPAFMAHLNPDIFPEPEKFDPDRFLPDNVQGRNPYAFVPFSAGPRNCIGQKFAILEMKSTIVHVLQQYKLLPGTEKPNLVLASELILISKSGVTVKIVPRH